MNNIDFSLYAGEQSQHVIYCFDSLDSLKDQFDQRGCVYLVLKRGTLQSAIIAGEWDLNEDNVFYVGHEDNLKLALSGRSLPIKFDENSLKLRNEGEGNYKFEFAYSDIEFGIIRPEHADDKTVRNYCKKEVLDNLGFKPKGNDLNAE